MTTTAVTMELCNGDVFEGVLFDDEVFFWVVCSQQNDVHKIQTFTALAANE